MIGGRRSAVIHDPGSKRSLLSRRGQADQAKAERSLSTMVPEVHPATTGAGIANAFAAADIPERELQDPDRTDLKWASTSLDQSGPCRPGRGNKVGYGLVPVAGVKTTEGKSGCFLDLGEE